MRSGNAIYYVLDGHTLGYVFDHQKDMMGVLASKPQLGAAWAEDPIFLGERTKFLRVAQPSDFDFFRVQIPSDATPVRYCVVAGKYEEYQGKVIEDVKYCNDFETEKEAYDCIFDNSLNTYHFCRVDVI